MLVPELPEPLHVFELYPVWAIVHDQVILIQNDDFVPGSFLVEQVDGGDRNGIVNHG